MNDDEQFDTLLELFRRVTREMIDGLENTFNRRSIAEWQNEYQKLLARYMTAASLLGSEQSQLPEAKHNERDRLTQRDVRAQFSYLGGFVAEMQNEREWRKGWNSRAEMYANAIKTPYWRGRTRMLALPAMPAQGTICLTNCGCKWDIREYDDRWECFWVRGKDDSCQTCMQRAADWSPYVLPKEAEHELTSNVLTTRKQIEQLTGKKSKHSGIVNEDVPNGALGAYRWKDQAISIKSGMSAAETHYTIVHELFHSLAKADKIQSKNVDGYLYYPGYEEGFVDLLARKYAVRSAPDALKSLVAEYVESRNSLNNVDLYGRYVKSVQYIQRNLQISPENEDKWLLDMLTKYTIEERREKMMKDLTHIHGKDVATRLIGQLDEVLASK